MLEFRNLALLRCGGCLCLALAALPAGEPASGRLPLLMPDDFTAMHLVSWRVEPGTPDPRNPLLEPAMPWDSGGIMAHGTVLRDPIDGIPLPRSS